MKENNIFMLCTHIDKQAFIGLDDKYTIRKLRTEELDTWKTIHFDTEADKKEYKPFMDKYFQKTYADRANEFFDRCLVICENDRIIGTCFTWKIESGTWTIHWFKVKAEYANLGIGRQLFRQVLKSWGAGTAPLLLHTHPVSYAAIKLYSVFGFSFLTDSKVGARNNHLEEFRELLILGLGKEVYNGIDEIELPYRIKNKLKTHQSENF